MRDRAKRIWDGEQLDSEEEYLFMSWFEEAESLGLVGNIVRQPEFPLSERQSIELKAPTKRNPDKMKEKFLLHPHTYRADFSFEVMVYEDDKGNLVPELNKLCSRVPGHILSHYYQDRYICIVDVKGGWSNHRSQNSSDVTFPLNQKWVYDKYKLFVHKAVITPKKGWFRDFWAPDEAFVTEKGNPSKKYRTCSRFEDVKKYMEENK